MGFSLPKCCSFCGHIQFCDIGKTNEMESQKPNESKHDYWHRILKEFYNDGHSINITQFLEHSRNSHHDYKVTESVCKTLLKEADEHGVMEFDKFVQIVQCSSGGYKWSFGYCLKRYFDFVKFIIPAEKKICKEFEKLTHIHCHKDEENRSPSIFRQISNNIQEHLYENKNKQHESPGIMMSSRICSSQEEVYLSSEETDFKAYSPSLPNLSLPNEDEPLVHFSHPNPNVCMFSAPMANVLEKSPSLPERGKPRFSYFRQISMYSANTASYEDEYTCKPPPLFIFSISVLQIALYCIDQGLGYPANASGPVAVLTVYDPDKRKEVWRYFTYMFVHIGKWHLLMNLIVQLVLGLPLESVNKWFRIMLVYVSGVVAGSLGTFITDPGSLLSGASGGVYSLITAHVASIIMNWSDMSYPLVHLIVFAIFIICDVGSSYYNRFELNIRDNIGVSAHMFGALAGLLVGITVLRNIVVKKYEKVIQLLSVIFFCALMTVAIVCNIFSYTF